MTEESISSATISERQDNSNVIHLRNRRVPSGIPDTWEDAQKHGYKSKNSWRKAIKKGLNKEKRLTLRAREKERRKEKKKIAKENGIIIEKPKLYKMEDSNHKQRICVDLDFSNMMNEDDQKGTLNQVNFCYGINRRMENPFQLYFCGIDDTMMKLAEEKRFFNNWDVYVKREKVNQLFKPEEIVYLCAESPNILEKLDEDKVYVIGGLLDHNHYSGYCYNLALKNNYNHAKLPIIENNIQLSSRKVLTINQVFDILVKFKSGKQWKDALSEVIPQRKQTETIIKENNLFENTNDKEQQKEILTIEKNKISEK